MRVGLFEKKFFVPTPGKNHPPRHSPRPGGTPPSGTPLAPSKDTAQHTPSNGAPAHRVYPKGDQIPKGHP